MVPHRPMGSPWGFGAPSGTHGTAARLNLVPCRRINFSFLTLAWRDRLRAWSSGCALLLPLSPFPFVPLHPTEVFIQFYFILLVHGQAAWPAYTDRSNAACDSDKQNAVSFSLIKAARPVCKCWPGSRRGAAQQKKAHLHSASAPLRFPCFCNRGEHSLTN